MSASGKRKRNENDDVEQELEMALLKKEALAARVQEREAQIAAWQENVYWWQESQAAWQESTAAWQESAASLKAQLEQEQAGNHVLQVPVVLLGVLSCVCCTLELY